jgi:hypothetical protein
LIENPATMTAQPKLLIHLVRLLVLAGAAALLILPPLFWSDPDWVRAAAPSVAGVSIDAADAGLRWRGLLGSLPVIGLGLFVLWRLWQLFAEYARGRALGRPALARLRSFARALLAWVIAKPLVGAAMSVLMTWDNPPGQRQLVLSFSSDDYLMVLLAAVLLCIAHVMHTAVQAAEENEGFV